MPALVKSSVGSLAGTSEELCTRRCCFDSKNLRKVSRMSAPFHSLVVLDGIIQVYRGLAVRANAASPLVRLALVAAPDGRRKRFYRTDKRLLQTAVSASSGLADSRLARASSEMFQRLRIA